MYGANMDIPVGRPKHIGLLRRRKSNAPGNSQNSRSAQYLIFHSIFLEAIDGTFNHYPVSISTHFPQEQSSFTNISPPLVASGRPVGSMQSLAAPHARLLPPTQSPACRRLQQPLKRRAFHVIWRRADCRVFQAVAHRLQLFDHPINLICLIRQQLAVNVGLSVRGEHLRNFFQRKTGGTTERDERQAFDHAGVEATAQTLPAGGGDEALFFVEA